MNKNIIRNYPKFDTDQSKSNYHYALPWDEAIFSNRFKKDDKLQNPLITGKQKKLMAKDKIEPKLANIEADHRFINLPFKCPICGSGITGICESWTVGENEKWKADSITLECRKEPCFDDENFNEFMNHHYCMPYEDWHPLVIKVTKWVNENYNFIL